jgi:CubicO group peptidase (beta-lactamase class C family)
MAEIHGYCSDRFADLREALSQNIDSGEDVGAAIAIVLDGQMVVDMWGGWVDEAHSAPWAEDTITNVWSSTKTMIALASLLLVDRGELDVHQKVAHYWPEFAANGKADMEVRHLLSHTSGLPAWQQPVVVDDIYDWEKSTAMLAAQAPRWAYGTASGYQALNHGHLIGEVIRRITGLQPGAFFAEQIAAPLGADFHIGLDPAEFGRVSNVIPPPPLQLTGPGMVSDGLPPVGPALDATYAWSDGWRQADIGAANGHGNARSAALIQSAVTNGGAVGETQLLSAATLETIFEEQSNGRDKVLGIPIRFGIGYGLPLMAYRPYIPEGRKCFWGGWGGSSVLNDLDNRMTFTYMMNKMASGVAGSPRTEQYIRAAYAGLGVTV